MSQKAPTIKLGGAPYEDAFADIMADAPQNSPCDAFADYAEHLCRSGQPLSSNFVGLGTHC